MSKHKRPGVPEIREKIDRIDESIVRLLNRRARLAQRIGEVKSHTGQEYYNPAREHRIYRRLIETSDGIFPKQGLLAVFREIQSACLSLEEPLQVVYLGPEASYTHISARQKFGTRAEYLPVSTITDVFEEVNRNRGLYGIIPIENTTEGAVTHSLDMFLEYDLKICSELTIPIGHCLLSRAKTPGRIKRIYSQSQALAQCRVYLETNFPGVEVRETSSTAEAARQASFEATSAAIASELASEVYKIPVIEKNIEDRKSNFTRFLVIGHNFAERTGIDKTSIVFSVKDEVGVLHKMLKPFGENKVNLTKIESRPSRTHLWEYAFFIDFDGYFTDTPVKRALKSLERHCIFLKVLGSYPREVRADE